MARTGRASAARKRKQAVRQLDRPRSAPIFIGLLAFTALFIAAIVLAFPNQGQSGESVGTSFQDAPASDLGASRSPSVKAAEIPPAARPGLKVGTSPELSFQRCGQARINCVVDGDTFWLRGQKIRIADINAPEISKPECEQERALGLESTRRLTQLLSAGPFDIESAGDRDRDRYGRLLRIVVRDGQSIGDRLIAEGLAHRWMGAKQSWC